MPVHDAQSAAEVLRSKFESEEQLSPEARHDAKFFAEVCEHLGVKASAENLSKVFALARAHGIEPYRPADYPKQVGTHESGAPIIAESAEHEKELAGAGAAPEPEVPAKPKVEPLPRVPRA